MRPTSLDFSGAKFSCQYVECFDHGFIGIPGQFWSILPISRKKSLCKVRDFSSVAAAAARIFFDSKTEIENYSTGFFFLEKSRFFIIIRKTFFYALSVLWEFFVYATVAVKTPVYLRQSRSVSEFFDKRRKFIGHFLSHGVVCCWLFLLNCCDEHE